MRFAFSALTRKQPHEPGGGERAGSAARRIGVRCLEVAVLLGSFFAPSVVFSGCIAGLLRSGSVIGAAAVVCMMAALFIAATVRVAITLRRTGVLQLDLAALALGLPVALAVGVLFWRNGP